MEIWKDCVGFEGFCEVSNQGRVRRKLNQTMYKDGRVAYFSQTILKPALCRKGYERVYLSVGSKKSTRRLHRLVALTFIDNPGNLPQVNHKDTDKLNNHVDNLEWISNEGNMQHAFKNGIYKERDKTTILNIKHMRDKLCGQSV